MSAARQRSEDQRTVAGYCMVWASLLGLLALTTASSFVDLRGWNSAINMVIAATKAGLVAWFFMRLRNAAPLLRFAAAAGMVWVALLIGLALADLAFRAP